MHSAIYSGWVRHRRFKPAAHEFRYKLFMMYLDLAELPRLFDRFWLWSARRPALAWFRRSDYLQRGGEGATSLDEAVRELVKRETGTAPRGPIRLLTHLRYFGHCFNPVSFYYCFDERGEKVETIVAEITNTPWGERHAYVLPAHGSGSRDATLRFRFDKRFHVSPFMPMQMTYDWRLTAPGERLLVHMENLRDGQRAFDATLSLERREISGGALARTLLRFPLMTLRVMAAIHWQALRLWLKRVPFHSHPAKSPGELAHESQHRPR